MKNLTSDELLVFFITSSNHLSTAATCLIALLFVILIIVGCNNFLLCIERCSKREAIYQQEANIVDRRPQEESDRLTKISDRVETLRNAVALTRRIERMYHSLIPTCVDEAEELETVLTDLEAKRPISTGITGKSFVLKRVNRKTGISLILQELRFVLVCCHYYTAILMDTVNRSKTVFHYRTVDKSEVHNYYILEELVIGLLVMCGIISLSCVMLLCRYIGKWLNDKRTLHRWISLQPVISRSFEFGNLVHYFLVVRWVLLLLDVLWISIVMCTISCIMMCLARILRLWCLYMSQLHCQVIDLTRPVI